MATVGKRNQVTVTQEMPDSSASLPPPSKNRFETFLYRFPWWLAFLVGVGLYIAINILSDDLYYGIFLQLRAGIEMTLRISLISFTGGVIIGLIVGMIRSSPPVPRTGLWNRVVSILHLILYNIATLFVEVARGLPILTVLLIFAFVVIPEVKDSIAASYDVEIDIRGASVETGIIALAVVYGAFLSEIFRAGIQSIGKGQVEAARSLGMTNWQTMRFVVLPQAIRQVIPPLGNDFIAIIKDSSLISIYGVREVTQIAKVVSGSNFQFMPTYLTAAVIYLSMTVLGSLLVRALERRLGKSRH
ncbi:MAG: amino acid ABC transporter permease [Anaerolineae bacterium]